MASLRGDPGSVWTLHRAVAAMRDAARQASVPSSLWITGFTYQGLNLGWAFGVLVAWRLMDSAMPGIFDDETVAFMMRRNLDPLSMAWTQWWPLLFVTPLFFRLVAGLAVLSPAANWEEARGHRRAPKLGAAMRKGRGLAWPVIALWAQFLAMMFGAALIFVGPAKVFTEALTLEASNPITVLIAGAVGVAIYFYGVVLSVLFQIALHSLVQNQRGVGSALLHAWRIAKNDPMATVRATVVDATVFVVAWTTIFIYMMILGALPLPGSISVLAALPAFALEGVIGCTRCAYWARAYEALGGISTMSQE
ncbi:MAG: hypothetical protein ACI8QZ_004227 [Chlamydiales bacterium]|jgi:hypothetical protein